MEATCLKGGRANAGMPFTATRLQSIRHLKANPEGIRRCAARWSAAILAGIFSVTACMPASAASMSANITNIWELSGKIYLGLGNWQWDGSPTSCTPSTPMYLIDPNYAVGRAQFALAVTAKTTGAKVYLVGDGTCVGGGPNGDLAENLIGIQVN